MVSEKIYNCIYVVKLFFILLERLIECSDTNWEDIVTPINVKKLDELLLKSNYPVDRRQFIVQGFNQGFDISYSGSMDRVHESRNIPLKVGSPIEMWNKIMKEVVNRCFAGPYTQDKLPFNKYVQSQIGLVPKAGNKTRLIFHLSFDFGQKLEDKSINY